MLKVGDKVRFLKDITGHDSRDSQPVIFAKAGDIGILVEPGIASHKVHADSFPLEFWIWSDEIEPITKT